MATASAEETRAAAAELATVLPADTTLALHGDLGVGKTTFVQGLAHGLGIAARVTSPTFALYSIYDGPRGRLIHLDAYRLHGPEQIASLLLEDFLTSPFCLAVEWPEKTGSWLPPEAWHLTLSIAGEERHRLQLSPESGG